jgi:hypothetical protein
MALPSKKLQDYVKSELQGPNDLTDAQAYDLAHAVDNFIDTWFENLDKK